MPTTTLGITYPSSTSSVRVYQDIQQAATDTDTLISADRTKRDAAGSTYTPSITGSTSGTYTLGNGTWSARYIRLGRMVFVWGDLTVGSTTSFAAVSGTFLITLPVTAQGTAPSTIGTGFLFDSSTATRQTTTAQINTTTTFLMAYSAVGGLVNNAAPWAWATSDLIRFQLMYEASTAA